MKISTKLLSHLAVTGSLSEYFALGAIRIYAGTVPTTADASVGSATLLGAIGLDDPAVLLDVAPVAYLVAPAGWTASGSGDPSFARIVDAEGDCGLQLTAGGPGDTAELIASAESVVAGDELTIGLVYLTGVPS